MLKTLLATAAAATLITSAVQAQDIELWLIEDQAAADSTDEGDVRPISLEHRIALTREFLRLREGDRVQIPVPGMAQAVGGVVDRIEVTSTGGVRLYASLDDGGAVSLHRGLNATFGRLWAGGQVYQITTADGRLILGPPPPEQGDPGRDGPDVIVPDDREIRFLPDASSTGDSPASGHHVLDFIYFYDQDMIDQYGWGLLDIALTDLGNLQTSLDNSGVNLGVNLIEMRFIDVAHEYSSSTLLNNALNNAGVFTGLNAMMAAIGADVASINRVYDASRENFCGIGYLHNPTSNLGGRYHLNVCHNGLTLAHETGHNMGLAHGVLTDGTSGVPHRWARGFRIDGQAGNGSIFTSVMAYGNNRFPEFSDPTRPCPERGSMCGVPVGQTDDADATQSLSTYAVGFPAQRVPRTRLRSAVLPTSRFVSVGETATAFMTVINPNAGQATNCRLRLHGPDRQHFSFQRTDPNTNAVVGGVNEAFNIPGGGVQTLVLAYAPQGALNGIVFAPSISCDDAPMAEVTLGLNTMNLNATGGAHPDIIALSATINSDGVVNVPDGPAGVFSVAAINLGDPAEVTFSAVSVHPDLPATAEVCQTNAQGVCMAPRAPSVTLTIGANETPTFGVFVRTDYPTPFAPRQRLQAQFVNGGGQVVGSTSVAVRDLAALEAPHAANFDFATTTYTPVSGQLSDHVTGYVTGYEIVTGPGGGSIDINGSTGAYMYTPPNQAGADSFTWRALNPGGPSTPATSEVNITPLPAPQVQNFAAIDDAGGFALTYDLDDFSTGTIAGFNMVTPPAAPFTFNSLTGVINVTSLQDEGQVTFSFEAFNQQATSGTATATLNLVEFNLCAPQNITRSRLQRRLERVDVGAANSTATMEEAEGIAEDLCLTETQRDANWLYLQSVQNQVQIVLGPRSSPGRFIVYYRNFGAPTWEGNFTMCKFGGALSVC